MYGETFLSVMRIVPRAFCGTASTFSSSEPTSSPDSSSGPRSLWRALWMLGTGPETSNGAADRRNPRSSNWLDKIFLSWSVMPFPAEDHISVISPVKTTYSTSVADLCGGNSRRSGQTSFLSMGHSDLAWWHQHQRAPRRPCCATQQ